MNTITAAIRYLGFIFTCVSFVVVAGCASFGRDFNSANVSKLAGRMAENIIKSGKKRVAVVDFTDLQTNVTELGRFLAEEVSIALVTSAQGFRVVDRTHLKALLQEHKLAATGIIDPPTARKLGQIAGVDALVTGSITSFGDSVRLSAKVLDVSTAEILGAFPVDIPKTKAIEDHLARGVVAGSPIGMPATPTSSIQASARTSMMSTEDNKFLFALRSCVRSGQSVTCSGSVTNRAPARRHFSFYDGYIVDNLGNQYVRAESTLGAYRRQNYGDLSQELEPELPMNFSLTVAGVAAEASSVTVVVSYSAAGSGSSKATLRNAPLLQPQAR